MEMTFLRIVLWADFLTGPVSSGGHSGERRSDVDEAVDQQRRLQCRNRCRSAGGHRLRERHTHQRDVDIDDAVPLRGQHQCQRLPSQRADRAALHVTGTERFSAGHFPLSNTNRNGRLPRRSLRIPSLRHHPRHRLHVRRTAECHCPTDPDQLRRLLVARISTTQCHSSSNTFRLELCNVKPGYVIKSRKKFKCFDRVKQSASQIPFDLKTILNTEGFKQILKLISYLVAFIHLRMQRRMTGYLFGAS
jgi:hypothetical protein